VEVVDSAIVIVETVVKLGEVASAAMSAEALALPAVTVAAAKAFVVNIITERKRRTALETGRVIFLII